MKVLTTVKNGTNGAGQALDTLARLLPESLQLRSSREEQSSGSVTLSAFEYGLEAARTLASRFSLACVKLGEDGAIAVAGHEMERRSAVPVIRRSPFGAGDAFGGALLVALAAGDPLGVALQHACDEGGRAAAR